MPSIRKERHENTHFTKKIVPGNVLFNSFDDIFGEDVLKELRKLAGSKMSDSTFILKCMRKLYSESEVLKSKTASGTDGKSTVSPENIFGATF